MSGFEKELLEAGGTVEMVVVVVVLMWVHACSCHSEPVHPPCGFWDGTQVLCTAAGSIFI